MDLNLNFDFLSSGVDSLGRCALATSRLHLDHGHIDYEDVRSDTRFLGYIGYVGLC